MSDHDASRDERARALKERIYVTFAALAVVVTLASHGEHDALNALVTLLVTVLGTIFAVFTADVISHLVVHERLMSARELRSAAATSFGALGAVALPAVLLLVAALGAWPTFTALVAAAAALLLALVVIGYLAIRRLRLAWWQRLVALGAEALLGVLTAGLQLLAHG
ncbi:MAG: hypothetical protein CMH36_00445 [Microbacterium sp.]|jgi:hypothetical protein|uniref:VIT family protein n=1 Tax=Microbacterium ginsengisoli TaxID=400772 RepID=A0A0F0M157_9MICO|nr:MULTISPECIES: hypothetical protein [Microbacterium]MAL05323.1 hypothetical protein [Microbacterium sp.]MCK9917403.1 hypothetical protein [Microbacteriaceae bacterium K1510]KJL44622.1 hypothetical protein RR49_00132 [Microbacterium ginsengisoli]KQR99265.1 hypothetical protein ASF93_12450 [Microbacterium sp. Leaf347]KQS02572.1 hypothetical protein ASG00_09630 [Microbacterium sp. Leaf351]